MGSVAAVLLFIFSLLMHRTISCTLRFGPLGYFVLVICVPLHRVDVPISLGLFKLYYDENVGYKL